MYIQTLHRFLCFLVLISYTHADAPVSIQQMPGYGNVRPCVSDCIGGNRWMGDYGWEIGAAIGCGTLDPRNDCVCRPDLQAGGEAYLSSCLDRSCAANTIDIASGMSLYTNYCTSAGYNRAAATAAPSGMSKHPQTSTQGTVCMCVARMGDHFVKWLRLLNFDALFPTIYHSNKPVRYLLLFTHFLAVRKHTISNIITI